MSKLQELARIGQSVWLDYIRRAFIESGDLQALIDQGLRGVTSNPSIFKDAIAGSTDYDDDLHRLAEEGLSVEEIYERLAVEDIRRACDLFRPVYERTQGIDGYVSLEVSPTLAYDTEATIAEARRLFRLVDRPNVMIKIPATAEGLPAIEQALAEGINVNVTLLFSVERYLEVVEAFFRGLERLAEAGGDLSRIASVASFFVSRLDTKLDPQLEALGATDLLGRIGIANAKVAYQAFRERFRDPRWQALAAKGARVQRVLWGSTSTKNPAYPDTLYVDELIGPNTVNTIPPATLRAFLDHGTLARTLDKEVDQVRAQIARLAELGVDLNQATAELLEEGVERFATAFQHLLDSIEEKRRRLKAGAVHNEARLGALEKKSR